MLHSLSAVCCASVVEIWDALKEEKLVSCHDPEEFRQYQVVCLALMTQHVLREWNILPKGSLSSASMRASSDHICKAHGHVGKIQNYLDACSM